MADTAYDADHLRQAIAAKGAIAVIPNNPSRALKHPLDKHLYAQRYLVECSKRARGQSFNTFRSIAIVDHHLDFSVRWNAASGSTRTFNSL